MSTYIHSTANRSYVAVESAFGQPANITAACRIPAFRVHAHQQFEALRRRDKTGARTACNVPGTLASQTNFELETYLVSWNGTNQPLTGALFQAACGAPPVLSSGLVVASAQGVQLQTTAPHNLNAGSAISYGGELRFVTQVIDSQTVQVNAPFTNQPSQGAALQPAITYSLGTHLPSLTIYDYWDPVTAVSRIITGAVVDTMHLSLDGPYHELVFSGPASDLLDSTSVNTASSNLAAFPPEPGVSPLIYSVFPGHLGELWIGTPANQFFTLTDASVLLRNQVEMRNHEYGYNTPRAVTPSRREISISLKLFAGDDAQTIALDAAAKQRSPLPIMLQIGNQQGHTMALYMPNVTPNVPLYDDSQPRLAWEFESSPARGSANDELYIAFG